MGMRHGGIITGPGSKGPGLGVSDVVVVGYCELCVRERVRGGFSLRLRVRVGSAFLAGLVVVCGGDKYLCFCVCVLFSFYSWPS